MSSESRDLYAEFGILNPFSPPLSSPLVLSSADMVVSDACPLAVVSYSDDMMESEPIPSAIVISSEDSTSLVNHLEDNLGPALGSNYSEIFKAAQHFSQKDRDEALFERGKNLNLMNFLSAHGFTANDVNAFVTEGKLVTSGHARQVRGECPLDSSAVPNALPSSVNV